MMLALKTVPEIDQSQRSLFDKVAEFLHAACGFETATEAAEAIARTLVTISNIDEAQVDVSLTGAVACAKVRRAELSFGQENKSFGTVDIISESRKYGIYRLNIAPGKSIPLHFHEQMKEAEFVLGDGLKLQGDPVARGHCSFWKKGERHRYDNETGEIQSVLCVDSPPFIPSDEIEVSES